MSSWQDGSFLVIGASGGIGSAVAQRLSAAGAGVVLAARNQEPLDALELPKPALGTIALDARRFDEVEAALKHAAELGGGKLQGVTLCVGSILLKPAHGTSEEEWQDTVERNLTSAFAVVRAAGKVMRKGGSVVFCSTAAALTGLANHDAIAAAKAGVIGLARSAAASYANRGLRFNVVAPGLVRTPLASRITENEAALEASRKMHALGRIGEPDDVASAICWLLDPANSWVSGDVLRVDGGLSSLRPVPRG